MNREKLIEILTRYEQESEWDKEMLADFILENLKPAWEGEAQSLSVSAWERMGDGGFYSVNPLENDSGDHNLWDSLVPGNKKIKVFIREVE